MGIMRIYYLDSELSPEDMIFLKESIASREGIGWIQKIEQIRVPSVLPSDLDLKNISLEKQLELVRNSLVKSGIEVDIGKQIIWVMPKDTHWGMKFQMAILEITGIGPYTLQRWRRDEDGHLELGYPRLIDTQGLLGGKG